MDNVLKQRVYLKVGEKKLEDSLLEVARDVPTIC